MGKIAPIIGSEHTREIFFDRFVQLTSAFPHNIRKHCATVFPVMCEVLGTDLLETDMVSNYTNLKK